MTKKFTFKPATRGILCTVLGVYAYCFLAPINTDNYLSGLKAQLLDKGIPYTVIALVLIVLFWIFTRQSSKHE